MVLYVSESLWLLVCDQQKEELDLMNPGTKRALGNVIRMKTYALARMEYPISHLGFFIVVFSFLWVIFHYCFMSILLFPCFSSQNLNWSWVILGVLGFPAVCHTRDLLFFHSAECPDDGSLPHCYPPALLLGIWLTVSWLGALPLYPLLYTKKKIIPPPLLESIKLSPPVPGLIQNPLPPGTLLW